MNKNNWLNDWENINGWNDLFRKPKGMDHDQDIPYDKSWSPTQEVIDYWNRSFPNDPPVTMEDINAKPKKAETKFCGWCVYKGMTMADNIEIAVSAWKIPEKFLNLDRI